MIKTGTTVHKLQIAAFWDIYISPISPPIFIYIYSTLKFFDKIFIFVGAMSGKKIFCTGCHKSAVRGSNTKISKINS